METMSDARLAAIKAYLRTQEAGPKPVDEHTYKMIKELVTEVLAHEKEKD